ncbi:MAG: flagellar motor protein [Dehalococcoidia bacterium]|nr:flagellar motor protein [Dehalococcoidia bacterium]
MGATTIAGLLIAAIGILGGFVVEGGAMVSLMNLPGFMIVVVGTLGATIASFPPAQVKSIPASYRRALQGGGGPEPHEMASRLVSMADKARREGLLSLEDDAQNVGDDFARKGLTLMIDGTDPEALRSILEIEIEGGVQRESEKAEVFRAASGFSPTLGVLGAVMGLITVLGKLGGDVAELGHGIAVAFVATFYGVGFANVVLLPMAMKLKAIANEEQTVREMILEGILAIQAGDNPRIVREKLQSYLAPEARTPEDDDVAAGQAAA